MAPPPPARRAPIPIADHRRAAAPPRPSPRSCWQVDRQPNGTIIADPTRFPGGMASVAAYIRGLGLKAGLYTAQREFTCQQRPGSWRFEDIDIDTYCDLGIEYVKTDGCFGRGWAVDNVTWVHFRAGIERCVARGGREIVLSVESCGDASCGAWIGGLANLWRTTGDIQATWASVMSNRECRERAGKREGEGRRRTLPARSPQRA